MPWPAVSQRVRLWGSFSQHPVGGQRIHHVAEHGIVGTVTNEAHDMVAEHFADETRGPAFSQVSEAEITAGRDETIQRVRVALLRQLAVEVDETVAATVFGMGSIGAANTRKGRFVR